ncbi:MAG TPA: helix-turn-helix domain-containing protein [Ktedonobacterales bacterium]|nr:helix-turn-helix domain-containing protein [Ktedonobacterales bacterium]
MEDIPETYQLETIEQMRALAEELRIRIIEALGQQAMTSKQIALLLNEAPAKVHYHLHELEKVGLVHLVDIREKGNMLEKYYRAIAKNISASETLFQRVPPDETLAAMREFLQHITQRLLQVLSLAASQPPKVHISAHLNGEQLWMTDEEYQQLIKHIGTLVEPYKLPRSNVGEREYTFVEMVYPMLPSSAETEASETPAAPVSAAPTPAERSKAAEEKPYHAATSTGVQFTTDESLPKKARMFGAGGFSYSRKGLEEVIAQGKQLDIQVLGYCSFADDVTPDLVDRAIARFRCRGKVNASPEVREALKRKEVKPEREQ